MGGVAPLLTPVDHPAVRILCEAMENVWGKKPLFTRSGGSGPEEGLGRILEAPVIFLGVGLPEDNYHAPNERLELDQLWKGIAAAGELVLGLASRKSRANDPRPAHRLQDKWHPNGAHTARK